MRIYKKKNKNKNKEIMQTKKETLSPENKIKKLENLTRKQRTTINKLKQVQSEQLNRVSELTEKISFAAYRIKELENIPKKISIFDKFKKWTVKHFKFIFIFMGCLFIFNYTNSSPVNNNIKLNNNTNEFSKENLLFVIDSLNILHPEITIAQIKLETANYSSNIFKENNNLFGMKLPKIRKTLATGENRKHAKYNNWKDSVIDYKLWQEHMLEKPLNKKDYLYYLSKRYAEDKKYIKKLNKILNN